jgi:hypothetical protein
MLCYCISLKKSRKIDWNFLQNALNYVKYNLIITTRKKTIISNTFEKTMFIKYIPNNLTYEDLKKKFVRMAVLLLLPDSFHCHCQYPTLSSFSFVTHNPPSLVTTITSQHPPSLRSATLPCTIFSAATAWYRPLFPPPTSSATQHPPLSQLPQGTIHL